MFDRLLNGVLDWIAPHSCAACQAALLHPSDLYCAACAAPCAGTSPQLRSLDGCPAWALGSYDGPLQTAIRRFKFEGHPELAPRFGRALADLLVHPRHPQESEADAELRHRLLVACLVPVPLHPLRLAERGFNQAALLAKTMAKTAPFRTSLRALMRTHHTEKQSRLGRSARQVNLAGQIQVRRVPGGPIVLVDDVLTTGATLSQCKQALELSGAQVVGFVTLAHTE